MEKIQNREKFIRELIEFRDLVQLKPELMSALEKHLFFSDEMRNVVQHLETDAEKKLFILVEFTRTRSTCEEMIRLLAESGQNKASEKLTEYNTSSGRIMFFKTTADIPLTRCRTPMKGSLFYPMQNIPRGQAIIINNVIKEIPMESERFKYIFEKLHFNCQLWDNLTKDEIEDKLKSFVNEEEVTETDAFLLMVISHGIDEKIMGSKACKALNILDKDPTDAQAVIDANTDVIDILKIVDIFSNTNCRKLLNKPKLFFFNCCRIKLSEQTEERPDDGVKSLAKPFTKLPTNESPTYERLKTIDEKWARDNQDTFICYACAEGYKSYYGDGITHFGQALSHSIAQYSCEETLNSIISRTCDLLQYYSDQSGSFAPEIRGKALRREIRFNP